MNIPFSPPDITELEIQAVAEALRSGWITTGPKTKQFENELAVFCGATRVVCLNSATAAMELVLRAMGIGPGDEVITSAYTYSASASVIDHVGARIVLVDTTKDTFFMDPVALDRAITPNTKAVIPVDIGGVMVDYDSILEVVEGKKGLFQPSNRVQEVFGRPIIMADAAHSIGATHRGRSSGSIADFSAFSFHAVKNLTTAEGGAVAWIDREGLDHEELYRQFQLLSLHGQSKDALSKMTLGAWEYDIVFPGYKCNMTDVTSALGLAQLNRFPSLMEKRLETLKAYDEAFLPQGALSLLHSGADYQGNGHLYLSRVPGITEQDRNEIVREMAEKGIACNVHFKPLPLFTAYKKLGFDINNYPNAFEQYCNEITLPTHTLLTLEEVGYICDSYGAILRKYL